MFSLDEALNSFLVFFYFSKQHTFDFVDMQWQAKERRNIIPKSLMGKCVRKKAVIVLFSIYIQK